ncbi:MAG: glycoside hydrolase family 9 protein [Bacteroidales bacterium]|nr:glycoside hydrolase family 9 protein [Bacteroidales bacterium]
MKKLIFLSGIVLLIAGACTSKQTKETEFGTYLYEHKPMPMDTTNSIQYKWDHKKILESVLIDGMESLENWELSFGKRENVAAISLSDEKVIEGKSSIKFISPTKLPISTGVNGRYWGRQNLIRKFNKEDFSKYNRISVNVYPQFKGFRKLYLTMILNNEGNVPDKYGKEGWHTVMLKNNQWNKLVMEIPHLPHDKVTAIILSYGLQGNEPDAADTIIYYVDNLILETVEADYYEGWGTDKAISFSHSGYNSKERKTAFTSLTGEDKFKVVDLATNNTVLEKDVLEQTSQIGAFSVFDFSEVNIPGKYKIVYGNIESKPFPIDNDAWLPIIEKITNYFYVQRCGYDQPGIHLKCHTDWYTVYNGDTIVMAGGWHDAGDLSQSYWQTASVTAAFFRLARQYQKENKRLSDRLIEEGMWGLEWLHKNRFDGLQVISWTTHDCYTDGVIGNFDDKPIQPGDRASTNDNYYAIIADVEASLALKKTNPELAEKSKKYAIEYWDLLAANPQRWNTERLSIAILAGTKLYGLTRSKEVKNRTIGYADSLLTYQQVEPMNWNIPLSGFFYMNKGTDRFFGYNHSCPAASPILGLVELCKLFPNHEKYPQWFKSVELHANYLKTIAQLTAPYFMIPANIYKLNGTADDAQILQGVKLDDNHYLRMFPVWQAFRGNSSVILSPGIGLASANQLLKDPEMHKIALSQIEWMQGKNPFSQSLMYGEGYYFTPQYAVFTGDVVGGLPVGILTRDDLDIPYWKASVLHNYKEIWGQPAFRMLELLAYLYN